jgi:K+-sensing histidine kinase KdpD
MNQESGMSGDFSLVLASSVHDMKNSLGMLLSSLDEVTLKVAEKIPECAKEFSVLQYEAARINTELVKLLSVYRMQLERMPVNIDEYFVIDLIEDQIVKNEALLESKNISINMECDESLKAFFDFELLSSVINDALVNGSRYSENKILIHAESCGDCIELSIHDDGKGYPDEMLGVVNNQLGVDAEYSERTHLGLYFSMKIAQLHQSNGNIGEVVLSNESVFSGGCFTIKIP